MYICMYIFFEYFVYIHKYCKYTYIVKIFETFVQ